jgi:putative chitinase
MAFSETIFFVYARRAPFGGGLSTAQKAGCKRLLATCRAERVIDLRQQAYVLASVFHETGGRMQPVREGVAANDTQAIARLDKAWAAGRLGKVSKPYWREGWFGRGDIQITHRDNYAKLGLAIGVDLVKRRELALDPKVSARVAVIGMRDGLFRSSNDGRPERLSRYFGADRAHAIAARAIVNGGGDKAKLIAQHYAAFLAALEAAEAGFAAAGDVQPGAPEAEPDDVPPSQSGSVGTVAVTTGAGAASAFVAGITNPWALLAFALILVAGGVGAWLLWSGRLTINRPKAAS